MPAAGAGLPIGAALPDEDERVPAECGTDVFEDGMDTDGMRIDNLRLEHGEPSQKGFRCVCTFTLQLTPEVKLYDLQLVQSPEGSLQVYAPAMRSGNRAWSFAPGLREKISKLAAEAMVSRMAWKAASLLPRTA